GVLHGARRTSRSGGESRCACARDEASARGDRAPGSSSIRPDARVRARPGPGPDGTARRDHLPDPSRGGRRVSIPEREWKEALAAITEAPRISLACHLGPDGDALGSLLAATIALRAAGHEVVASWGSKPFEVPPHYTYLPGLDLLSSPSSFPASPEL